MTPLMAAIGGLVAFFTVVLMVVVLPTETYHVKPSDNWLPLSNSAFRGRGIYLSNGCVYCHSGFSRPQDVFVGQYYLYPRASESGDFSGIEQSPNVLGTERIGPDLSQEGGSHPDDWHVSHYDNPRNVQPLSIMPRFSFLDETQVKDLIAFNQAQGGKDATLRTAAQTVGKKLMLINQGVDKPEDDFPDLVNSTTQEDTYVPDGTPMDRALPGACPGWEFGWSTASNAAIG